MIELEKLLLAVIVRIIQTRNDPWMLKLVSESRIGWKLKHLTLKHLLNTDKEK